MSSFDRQAILDCLSRLVTPGIKLTALADELGVRKHDYAALRSEVLSLCEEGTVVVLPGGAPWLRGGSPSSTWPASGAAARP